MDGRVKSQKMKSSLPKIEFLIFSAALNFLSKLDSKNRNDYQHAFDHLIDMCCLEKDKSTDTHNIRMQILELEDKFRRKISKSYDTEAFDLNVISESLDSMEKQEMYLQRDRAFHYKNPRQLINIVCKILNHFRLQKLSEILKENYFDQVDFIPIEKYLDPEHKPGKVNPPVTRYASLLTAMNSRSAKSNFNSPRPNNTFSTQSELRLFPKNKLTPRLPLFSAKVHDSTPSGIKYNIEEKEYLKDAAEIVSTEELLKIKNNKGASKTPGPILLSSFPIASSHNKSIQTIPDLLRIYGVATVVTIEEEFVAEQIFNGEKKALPSDWLQHGVSVGLVQCPDLHPLRLWHDLLVAQYLFAEVLTLLPPIKDKDHTDLINHLMTRRFQDSDKSNKLEIKKHFMSDLYHQITDEFKKINPDKQIDYLQKIETKLGWNKQAEQPKASSNQSHALIHCKAGMSRSATGLLSMYIMFIDVILRWHRNDFIKDGIDQAFFGAIVKAIFDPSHDPIQDIHNITGIFSTYYRPIKLLYDQVLTLAQLIQYKRSMLNQEAKLILDNNDSSQEEITLPALTYKK